MLNVKSRAGLLAVTAMLASGFGAAGMLPSFHVPERDRDSRSDEENARRLAAAEAKRARRAAKAQN